MEFAFAGNHESLKVDCTQSEAETEYCGQQIAQEKSVTFTGVVEFIIHLRNELQGTNATLFTGKMKVGKMANHPGGKDLNFYVDEDWRLPIGYIFLKKAENPSANGEPGASMFYATLWVRGNPRSIEAHLFYQGKDVAKTDSCSAGLPADKSKIRGEGGGPNTMWGGFECKFKSVFDVKVPSGASSEGTHLLRKNPGEYEIKALVDGHLARSVKFTVDANGKFDNGIATANKLGSDRVIVPVQLIGDQGVWDKTAWKTGAFYGNPLTGFTAVQ